MTDRPPLITIDAVASVACATLRQAHRLQPMLHIVRPDRAEIAVLADLPDSSGGRRAAMAAVGQRVAADGPVQVVYLVIEAWAVDLSPAAYAQGDYVQPRNHPARRDILVIQSWYPDGRPTERRQFTVILDGAVVTDVRPDPASAGWREMRNVMLDGFAEGYRAALPPATPPREARP
jgi:hypothetical protein